MADFLGATFEIFGRENIEASDFNAAVEDMISESFEIFEASVMALHTSEAAFFCPATVAVNNDCDMGRNLDGLAVDSSGFWFHIRGGNYTII